MTGIDLRLDACLGFIIRSLSRRRRQTIGKFSQTICGREFVTLERLFSNGYVIFFSPNNGAVFVVLLPCHDKTTASRRPQPVSQQRLQSEQTKYLKRNKKCFLVFSWNYSQCALVCVQGFDKMLGISYKQRLICHEITVSSYLFWVPHTPNMHWGSCVSQKKLIGTTVWESCQDLLKNYREDEESETMNEKVNSHADTPGKRGEHEAKTQTGTQEVPVIHLWYCDHVQWKERWTTAKVCSNSDSVFFIFLFSMYRFFSPPHKRL